MATESVYNGTPDLEVAREIESADLSNKLRNEEVRWLRKQGAGPRTVKAALNMLQRTADLPPAPEPHIAYQAPPPDEIRAVFDRIVRYVTGYLTNLVDFRGTLIVQKRMGKPANPNDRESTWKKPTTSAQEIGFYQGRELSEIPLPPRSTHKDRQPTRRAVWTQGEFASIIQATFSRKSKTAFTWDHWERLAGRRLAVFMFEVNYSHSQLVVDTEILESHHWERATLSPGYQGFLYADPATGAIVRLLLDVKNVPAAYLLNSSKLLLNYGPVELGGKRFFLLTDSTAYLDTKEYTTLIEKRFSNYRKFEAESKLLIDVP